MLFNPLTIQTNLETSPILYSSDSISPLLPSVSNDWLSHFYVNYFQAAAAAQNLLSTYSNTHAPSIYQDFQQHNQHQHHDSNNYFN